MSSQTFHADEIARSFVSARQAAQALPDYPGSPPLGLDQAYAVQDAAIALHGDRVAGWKVGRINAPWVEKLGTTRLAGPIFSNLVQWADEGEYSQAAVFDQGFGAIEAEFVARIGTAPPAGQTRFTHEEAAGLIDAVFCGLEVASSPYAGINADGPLVTVSDFGNNHGLILGPMVPNWQAADLEDWTVETRADGALLGSGTVRAFPGGMLESVRCLIENILARGLAVTPGLLISTGAVSGVHEVSPGQDIEARFGDFARLSCRIVTATA